MCAIAPLLSPFHSVLFRCCFHSPFVRRAWPPFSLSTTITHTHTQLSAAIWQCFVFAQSTFQNMVFAFFPRMQWQALAALCVNKKPSESSSSCNYWISCGLSRSNGIVVIKIEMVYGNFTLFLYVIVSVFRLGCHFCCLPSKWREKIGLPNKFTTSHIRIY